MLSERRHSLTVSAVLGTGLVTLGVAFTGMAGLSNDLSAAAQQGVPSTTPLTPVTNDDVVETLRQETRTTKHRIDCENRRKAREQVTGTTGSREL